MWLQKIFVKSLVIPESPSSELNFTPEQPIVYLIPIKSMSDVGNLHEITVKKGLPSPYDCFIVNGAKISRVLYLANRDSLFNGKLVNKEFRVNATKLLLLHKQNPELDIQLVPVNILWTRSPQKEKESWLSIIFNKASPTWLQKILMVIFLGRESCVQFSHAVSLRYMVNDHIINEKLVTKLLRITKVHFYRQRRVMTGPDLPSRKELLKEFIKSPALKQAIQEEMDAKQISYEKAEKLAIEYFEEIAASYSVNMIRSLRRFLTWVWNKLYRGVNVYGATPIRKLHHDGHEIVYIPCHRSHTDYLLLSFFLYQNGIIPPHIAAGINLNFWPAGPIFRRSGAFFIRRSFKGNKLYTIVFREYLTTLFKKGYSVEYFIEGGRSRIGRALQPKTGMLTMTVNTVLNGIDRPITLVPVYIGYDHVLEVATYQKELQGRKKNKESIWQVFKAIRKLGNFGSVSVNFGDPINIQDYLTVENANWKDDIANNKVTWVNPMIQGIALNIMQNINSAAVVSAVPLISTTLLATEQEAMLKIDLVKQLDLYLGMLSKHAYSKHIVVPECSGHEMLESTLTLNKYDLIKDPLGDIVRIKENSSVVMTYYRNNILHLFIIPALVATGVLKLQRCDEIEKIIVRLYPILKAELFIDIHNLEDYIRDIIAFFDEENLISISNECIKLTTKGESQLELLARIAHETIQRYAIALNIIAYEKTIDRSELEEKSQLMANHFGSIYNISAPEFYDKKMYGFLRTKIIELSLLDNIIELKDGINSLMDTREQASIVSSSSVDLL